MKKILAFMLVLLMSVALVACEKDDKNTSSAAGESITSEATSTADDSSAAESVVDESVESTAEVSE
ncbi:MAG: hypothetical protein A2Y17_10700 [Clostridiales bacterium GWF2_38_85]|nr:MAG: hypothetical protein A2Y17_10700 [Clostridiales bacterium GWF2_38_85]HBL83498.1 hypothetical protein [Clostridiales bacterium]